MAAASRSLNADMDIRPFWGGSGRPAWWSAAARTSGCRPRTRAIWPTRSRERGWWSCPVPTTIPGWAAPSPCWPPSRSSCTSPPLPRPKVSQRSAGDPPGKDDDNGGLMNQLVFDETAARRIEALYRIGDAVRRRGLVRAALGAAAGERILDVGCRPGYYCAELLQEVGPVRSGRRRRRQLGDAEAGRPPLRGATTWSSRRRTQPRSRWTTAVSTASCVSRCSSTWPTRRPPWPRCTGRCAPADAWWSGTSTGTPCRCTPRTRAPRRCCAPGTSTWLTRRCRGPLGRACVPRASRRCGWRPTLATAEYDADSYGSALTPFIGDFVAGQQGISEEDAQAWVDEQRSLGQRESSTSPAPSAASRR